jgi:hypothetical protein
MHHPVIIITTFFESKHCGDPCSGCSQLFPPLKGGEIQYTSTQHSSSVQWVICGELYCKGLVIIRLGRIIQFFSGRFRKWIPRSSRGMTTMYLHLSPSFLLLFSSSAFRLFHFPPRICDQSVSYPVICCRQGR